jgi:WD40 repeat protein
MNKKRRINILRIGILLVVAMCAVSIASVVTAQETPFVIYGYVFNADGTECNNPSVNIMNTATGESWTPDTSATLNYYFLLLVPGTDVNAGDVLRTEVTSPDGNQSKIVECAVSEGELNIDGGRCNYNFTLLVPNKQAWYFTNGSVTGPTGSGANYTRAMTKGVEGGNDKITLAPGERVRFCADQLAGCNVSFPKGDWEVSYWLKQLHEDDTFKKLQIHLQVVYPNGSYSTIDTYYVQLGHSQILRELTIPIYDVDTFTVPEGGRFALEIEWRSAANGNLELYCNLPDRRASQVTSPSSDPGYPISELPEPFDTGPGTYPSIAGTHYGEIIPKVDITVNKTYTYPCAGTGGHSEYVKIWDETTGECVVAEWDGYSGDYHNLSFNRTQTLREGVVYSYIIVTGSYPQIIHAPYKQLRNGNITCTRFEDYNGRIYHNRLPAIRLFQE